MKIIEALKAIKDLARKCSDLQTKIKAHCADLDFESPTYPDQRAQVKEWVQSYQDSVKEIARLRVAVQRTNVNTKVAITLDNTSVTKSIAEWVHWRRDLAKMMESVYGSLTDKGLREITVKQSNDQPMVAKVRRYFDPAERDKNLELYRGEPSKIDATLEIINATTDLMED